MNTKFIGVKEFRKNMADFAKQARKSKTRFVVVNRNRPLFEVAPFRENETLESLFNDVLEAKKDIAAGRVYTHEEIMDELS